MKLSKAQVTLFWRLWGQACRCQGWTTERGLSRAEIDQRRKSLLADCGFDSLTAVDKTAGFGRVKAALMTLCDRLDGAIEADHPEIDEARRLRHVITWDLMPRLARLPEFVASEDGVMGYVERICRDKFGLSEDWQLDLDDLDARPIIRTRPDGSLQESPSQLFQLLITLTARLRSHQDLSQMHANLRSDSPPQLSQLHSNSRKSGHFVSDSL